MVQEQEVIMLLLGMGVSIFAWVNHARLQRLPSRGLFLAGFHALLLGWVLTVLEGFFWPNMLNVVEHVCYAGSAALVLLWAYRVFGREGDRP